MFESQTFIFLFLQLFSKSSRALGWACRVTSQQGAGLWWQAAADDEDGEEAADNGIIIIVVMFSPQTEPTKIFLNSDFNHPTVPPVQPPSSPLLVDSMRWPSHCASACKTNMCLSLFTWALTPPPPYQSMVGGHSPTCSCKLPDFIWDQNNVSICSQTLFFPNESRTSGIFPIITFRLWLWSGLVSVPVVVLSGN